MTSQSNSKLDQKIQSNLASFITNEACVAVAVSGGGDSMALLLALHSLTETPDKPLKIVALTVDHNLRENAKEEAKQVGIWCQNLGIEHQVLTWQFEQAPTTAIQEKARNARYQLMGDYCAGHGIQKLFVAHNLEDNAETMFMRLKRGAGLKGLSSIAEVSQRIVKASQTIQIIRPLLDIEREELRSYLRDHKQAWFDDVSNENEKFERVKIRNHLNNADIFTHKTLAKSAKRLAVADDAIEFYVERFWQENVKLLNRGIATLAYDLLLDLPREIKLRILARLVWSIGGKPNPPRWQKIETALDQVENQSQTLCLGNCLIVKKRDQLWFGYEGRGEECASLTVLPQQKAMWQNRLVIENKSSKSIEIHNFEDVSPLSQELLNNDDQLNGCPKIILKKLPVICVRLTGQLHLATQHYAAIGLTLNICR
ncbi:MAG: tRNA lysidine(34) synthetase TilS [Hyphomicrobiales bacterium]